MSWMLDVAFDRADDHFANTRGAGFGQQWFQDCHPALHRVRGQQHLGYKQDTVAEICPNDGHATHKRFGQDVVGFPLAFKQDVHAFLDLFFQTIVKVIEHLLDKFFIVEL